MTRYPSNHPPRVALGKPVFLTSLLSCDGHEGHNGSFRLDLHYDDVDVQAFEYGTPTISYVPRRPHDVWDVTLQKCTVLMGESNRK